MVTRVTRDRLSRDRAPDPLARLHARQPPWLGAHIEEAAGSTRNRPAESLVVADAPSGVDVGHGAVAGDGPPPDVSDGPSLDEQLLNPSAPAWLNPTTRVAAAMSDGSSTDRLRVDHRAPGRDGFAPNRFDRENVDRDEFADDWSRSGEDRQDLSDRAASRRRRSPMAPPAAIALVVVGVLACVVTVVAVLSGGSDDAPTSVAFPASAGPAMQPVASSPASSPASGPGSGEAAQLVVSVVGLVRTPGLVRVPATSRIADAIAAAGGGRPGADLLSLNMAQPVKDGDQVLVGYSDPKGGPSLRSSIVSGAGAPSAPGASYPSGSPPSGTSAAATPSGNVDLNTADENALDALPGVGPVTAKAIVEWRTRNGRFSSVEQLAEVDGIGPARLARLRDLVHV